MSSKSSNFIALKIFARFINELQLAEIHTRSEYVCSSFTGRTYTSTERVVSLMGWRLILY